MPADRTRRRFEIGEATAVLSRTPATLDAMLRGLPEGLVHAHEGGETWSSFDVIGHLIEGEQADWVPRVRHIFEHGEAQPFQKFDRLAQFEKTMGRTLDSLLDEFAVARQASLRDLAQLRIAPADLERRSLHPALGVVTLRQLLATWVAHDLDHVVQVSRVLARQYTDEVGPWRAYLRVISGEQG